MRIIAGEFGGRRLAAPPGDRTRPMLEQARAAVFSMLGSEIEGARMLDLFSGTGSLGLEALSRGAQFVQFVERDAVAREYLQKNIDNLGVEKRTVVSRLSAEREAAAASAGSFHIISMDPPYAEITNIPRRKAVMTLLRDLYNRVLAPGGIVILHFPDKSLAEHDFAGLGLFRFRNYGRNAVAILKKDK